MFVGTGTIRKPVQYREARRLRRDEGMPLKRIAARVDVSVATVHAWTSDIELSQAQMERNIHGPRGPANPASIAARAAAWTRISRERRRAYQQEGRSQARQANPLHMAGCMLYWAEGSKSRNSVRLTNSDLNLLRFFCSILKTCFEPEPERFRVALHVYLGNGLSVAEIENHWLDALGLPRSCLRAHAIDVKPTSSSGRKKNKLPYGVCSLEICSTEIVQHIYGAIQEYARFEEPRWLG
jgi:hypothetical protein